MKSAYDILVRIAKSNEADVDLLIKLVQKIRPINKLNLAKAQESFHDVLFILEKDEYLLNGFRVYIASLLKGRKFGSLLSDLGIVSSRGFLNEITKRLYHKLLPIQPPENSMEYVLSNVFYNRNDYKWFSSIDAKSWEKLFNLLELKPIARKNISSFTISEILFSIELIALRISGSAMDYSLLRMVPEYEDFDSPFISLQNDITTWISDLRNGKGSRNIDDINARQVRLIIKQCNDYLKLAIENKERYGIDFFTTVKFVRLQQQLERLEILIDFITINPEEEISHNRLHKLLNQIIRLNSTKNDIKGFWNHSTGLVAYQITQHSGSTGEHYITSSRKGYKKMFMSAAGGGIIVGFMCIFKVNLSNIDASPFGQAFLYSLNYAIGFIAIYLFHFTLATKQPAMTAATLAKTLKKDKDSKISYSNFADLFASLFRSQFIAFVGNVLLSFIVAVMLFVVWSKLFGSDFLTASKSEFLLDEINIFKSKAILHAATAGVFLFLSGLISGYHINRNIYNKISYRIKKHPVLRKFFPDFFMEKVAKVYDKHIGGLSGNFWFGVMMGTTGAIGMFFGLDLGVRHITFAAGNFGLAIMGLNFHISIWAIIMSIIGIGVIGFFNFIVSFSLSLIVALRSRNLSLKDLKHVAYAIIIRFKQSRRDFFFPPPKKIYEIRANAESIIQTEEKK